MIKKRKVFLVYILLFLSGLCVSQEKDSLQKNDTIPSNIKLAYNSSLIYPGMRACFEFPLFVNHTTKKKRSGKIIKYTREQFLSGNVGWYHHPEFHDNIYITTGWIMRKTKLSGFFSEFSPELGYSRTFLGGTTYEVTDAGEVSIKKMAGYNYAFLSVGGGIGYDFSKRKKWPIAISLRANMLSLFPYNSTIYLRPTLEIGITYKPVRLLRFVTKTKYVIK